MSQGQKPLTPKVQVPSKARFTVILIILLAIYIYSGIKVQFSFTDLWNGLPNIGNLIVGMFPPNWNYFIHILDPMLETVKMAILGTFIGSVIGIPFTLLASRNVFKSRWVTGITRTILNLTRTMPDLLLASLFVAAVGIGPLAGILSLSVFAFGVITKLAYESVETIDPGPLESMTAVGANKWQFISFAVVPQAAPAFLAYVLYTFEVSIRASAILGLVGAGGIGVELQTQIDFMDYQKVSTIILFTLVIVIVIDTISTTVREKLL